MTPTTVAANKAVTYRGLGRRKASTARVILTPGKGEIKINNRPDIEYLKSSILVQNVRQPLVLTENQAAFDIRVNVHGGGIAGQAGAMRLGIARALLEVNGDFRPVLKKAKMLTRDSRVVERKKPGLRKARKTKQFSKR